MPISGIEVVDINRAFNSILNFKREFEFIQTQDIIFDSEIIIDYEVPSDFKIFLYSMGLANDDLCLEHGRSWYKQASIIDRFNNNNKFIGPGDDISRNALSDIGLVLKLSSAWDYVTNILIYRSDLSNELLSESSSELECSIMIASELFFFKQALQIIRNYFEICVSIIYFDINKKEFKKWQKDHNGYWFPVFREMVNELSTLLDIDERNYLHSVYTRLNHSVHLKRRRLNHYEKRSERIFWGDIVEDIKEWSSVIIEGMQFMLKLYLTKFFINENPGKQG